jgi:hypothetical protein
MRNGGKSIKWKGSREREREGGEREKEKEREGGERERKRERERGDMKNMKQKAAEICFLLIW